MEERSRTGQGSDGAEGGTAAEDDEERTQEMTLPYDRAHEVLDRACEKLDHWPRDFIGQEDLVMLIFEAIIAAVEEEREAWIKIATERREAIFDVRKDCDRNTRDYDVYTMQICELDHVISMIRARGSKD
jgi:hypothetical protein